MDGIANIRCIWSAKGWETDFESHLVIIVLVVVIIIARFRRIRRRIGTVHSAGSHIAADACKERFLGVNLERS
jgi:hypothetical protein